MQNFTFKIFALVVAICFATSSLRGQFVIVNSPDSLSGSYTYSVGSFGANLLDSIWTADAVVVNDGTATPTRLCADSVVNNIAGKIALMDRGTCTFVSKLIKAQKGGAIAGIIFNNAPNGGVIPMGGTDPAITMPCVMLSFEDGVKIKAALAAGATVNISLGNIRFAGDVAAPDNEVSIANLGAIPADQLQSLDPFKFLPGAVVRNIGTNDLTGAELKATIEYSSFDGSSSSIVYQDSFGIGSEVLAVDSAIIISLTDFIPDPSNLGYYDVSYEVKSDSTDVNQTNNTAVTDFAVTKNVFSKSTWLEAEQVPDLTTITTIAGGGEIEFITGFQIPKGLGYSIDSTTFYIAIDAPDSLGGRIVESYIYEWNDLNQNGGTTVDEISIVALAFLEFPTAVAARQGYVTLPFFDINTFEPGFKIPADDKTYLVGIRYRGEGIFRFGFDANKNAATYNQLETLNGTFTELDLPYLGINEWVDDITPNVDAGFTFTGLSSSLCVAVFVNEIGTNVKDLLATNEFKMEMYPNPVSDQLTTSLTLTEKSAFVEYEITDATGRRIFNQRKNGYVELDNAVFNVTALPAGQYFFTVRTEQGYATQTFAVKR